MFPHTLQALVRNAYLAPTDTAVDQIDALPLTTHVKVASAVGALIGLAQSFNAPHFSFVSLTYKIAAGTIGIVGFCVLWSGLFAWLNGSFQERQRFYPIFLGSTAFLAPAALPLLGPILFPALALGWIFVLARYCAYRLHLTPGLALVYLIIPPTFFFLILNAALFLIELFLSQNDRTFSSAVAPQ